MILFREWLLLEKKGEKHSYSCVMAVFNGKDAHFVMDWSQKHVKDRNLHIADNGGMGRENEIHVTVLYGLHTNDVKDIEEVKAEPFKITLGKISKFESEEYDVLKIEVQSPKLHQLNKKLKEFEYTSKFDKYVPHCTIAYVKKGSCDRLLGNEYFLGKEVSVDSLTFSPAEGKKTKINLDRKL